MRKLAITASLFAHALLVGGAVLWSDIELDGPRTPPRVAVDPSEPAALLPTTPRDAEPLVEKAPPLEELIDPPLLEPFEPPVTESAPPPPEESWLAKLRPQTAVRLRPPPVEAAAQPEFVQPVEAAFVRAQPLTEQNEPPRYPRRARRLEQEGEVWILAHVDEHGAVSDVELLRACAYAVLNEEALRAVRGWRFAPATRGGVAVAATVDVPIVFRLQDS
jgi:protein TonB